MKVLAPNGDKLDLMTVNIGPSHPATHGALRSFVALDGEEIVASVGEIGYLHRGFEKMAERGTFNQVLPYTDRLNYCSAIVNNLGYCKAVETMFGVEVPERAQVLRVLLSELSRVIDHGVCVAAAMNDVGAQTAYFYFYNPREIVYAIWEKLTGSRLTNSYGRIGGLYRDTYEGFEEDVRKAIDETEKGFLEGLAMIEHNRIFIDRTRDVGRISAEQALSWGWTGPCLRACGVNRDLRKDEPYFGYETYDFETVIGTSGDTYDRLIGRVYESLESLKICRQALDRLKPGPVNCFDPRLRLPPQELVYHDIESLIARFKLVYEGIRPPAGEHYDASEAINGELGYFIVADGSGHPYKVKVRSPCFTQYAAFYELIEGGMISDAVITLSSINIIGGELDR